MSEVYAVPSTEIKRIQISNSMSAEDLRLLGLLVDQHGSNQSKFKKSKDPASPITFIVRDREKTYEISLTHSLLTRGNSLVVLNDTRGKGSFAKTRSTLTFSRSEGNLSESPEKSPVVKVFKNKSLTEEEIQKEKQLFETVHDEHHKSCDFVARPKNLGHTKKYYFFMPDFGKQTLLDFLKNDELTSQERYYLAILVALAVKNMHDKGVIHRDLKPGNLMVDKEVKIIDFGFAKKENEKDSETSGTVEYVAPEIIGTPHLAGKPCDIFSLSRVFCDVFNIRVQRSMLDERLPNWLENEQYQLTPKKHVAFKEQFNNDDVAEHVLSLFRSMSLCDPEKRPNIDKVCETLFKKLPFLEEEQQILILKILCAYSTKKLDGLKTKIEKIESDDDVKTITKKIESIQTALAGIQTKSTLPEIKKDYQEIHSDIEDMTNNIIRNKNVSPTEKEQILYYLKLALDYLTLPLSFIIGLAIISYNDEIFNHGFFGTLGEGRELKSKEAKIYDTAIKEVKIAVPEIL